MKRSWHFLALLGAIAIGAGLRFWHLDAKPLWLDEVITAIFSLGRTYNDVPLEALFPHTALEQIFTLQPTTTCPEILHTVSTQSVHPPLFFCLMHRWLQMVAPLAQSWVWKLRALPAMLGVMAIAALYFLNRRAFSPQAGLTGAGLIAVSPFAVYLSQEARHYTLPMLLIILALLCLVEMQRDIEQARPFRPLIWLGWIAINGINFYVHYFSLIAFAAQATTLLGISLGRWRTVPRFYWAAIALAIAGVLLIYLPWLPTLLSHINRPETEWIASAHTSWVEQLVPLVQLAAAWVIMVVLLPVEQQPLWVIIPSALLMLIFVIWLVKILFQGFRQLWRQPEARSGTLTLTSFTVCVVLQYLGIVYILGKDITTVPRYNFTYYPAICALLAASLASLPRSIPMAIANAESAKHRWATWRIPGSVMIVGLISCLFIGLGLTFQKPYYPDRIAHHFLQETDKPIMVVSGYDTYLEVALSLSFDLEVHRQLSANPALNPNVYFGFWSRRPDYNHFWQQLSQTSIPVSPPLNLWVVASGLRRENFPEQVSLATQATNQPVRCDRDPEQYYRTGIPYQLYRCNAAP
jgi:uncharacterized membrane protein